METPSTPVYDFEDIVDLGQVRSKRICLLGCGAVGCNIILAALQTGWRSFTLVDFDTVSPHNCPRSGGLFHPYRDVGKSKARLLADYIRDWDPGCAAYAYEIDARDLGSGFFLQYDVVLCALDNMESVWHIGELMADTGIPLYRAATNGWNSSVEILENRPGEACLCCGMDPARAGDLRITSCGIRYLSDIQRGRAPALQVSSALCANRLVAEMTRRLGPSPDKRNLRYYDDGRSLMPFDLTLHPKCGCHGGLPDPLDLPGDVFSMRLDQLLYMLEERIGAGVVVYGADDYVLEGACYRCGEVYPINKPLRRVRESEMHCPHCPITSRGPDNASTLSVFSRNSPAAALNQTLANLGFRICGGILAAKAGGAPSLWRLSGDSEALFAMA